MANENDTNPPAAQPTPDAVREAAAANQSPAPAAPVNVQNDGAPADDTVAQANENTATLPVAEAQDPNVPAGYTELKPVAGSELPEQPYQREVEA